MKRRSGLFCFGGLLLIKINGTEAEIPECCSVIEMLTRRKIPAEMAIVVLNGEIVKRERWEDVVLVANDDVEIIRIIGGG